MCAYQVLSPRSHRLIVTTILQGHPRWLLGGTLEISFVADPRECGYAIQATLVCLHTHIQRRDLPAAGLPFHTRGILWLAIFGSFFLAPARRLLSNDVSYLFFIRERPLKFIDELCGQFQFHFASRRINRADKSNSLTASEMNCLPRQCQLIDNIRNELFRQFQLIDSTRNHLSGHLYLRVVLIGDIFPRVSRFVFYQDTEAFCHNL